MLIEKNTIYFPSLNGIRFIAATLVFVHHFVGFNFFRKSTGYQMESDFFSPMGGTGVTLFFVLSGYLITYLLLTEYKVESKISIRNFYIRRLLRIWPLYFFTIAINLLYSYFMSTLSTDFFTTKFLLYIFFLPNIASIIFISGGFPTQLWSVGTEEQFYLFWPWLISLFYRRIKWVLIFIPILFLVLRFGLNICLINMKTPLIIKGVNIIDFLTSFVCNFRIDCMAIGGGFAWLLFNKHKSLKIIYSKPIQVMALIITVLLIFLGFNSSAINFPLYSLLFGIIIINISANRMSVLSLKNRFFEELGKISYGLYVFHPLILMMVEKYIERKGIYSLWVIFLAFVISFGLNIFISYLSFKYIENPFLKLKYKFSKILSGNDIK